MRYRSVRPAVGSGNEPGLNAYTHASDEFAPFATQTTSATVHELPGILDGLLMNGAGPRVREQFADTGGFTLPNLARTPKWQDSNQCDG